MFETYLTLKRAELQALDGVDDAERCTRYAEVY
jgi:hypothetical protein